MSAGTSASLCCGLLSAFVLLVSAGESEQGNQFIPQVCLQLLGCRSEYAITLLFYIFRSFENACQSVFMDTLKLVLKVKKKTTLLYARGSSGVQGEACTQKINK